MRSVAVVRSTTHPRSRRWCAPRLLLGHPASTRADSLRPALRPRPRFQGLQYAELARDDRVVVGCLQSRLHIRRQCQRAVLPGARMGPRAATVQRGVRICCAGVLDTRKAWEGGVRRNATVGIETCTSRISDGGRDEHRTPHQASTELLITPPADGTARAPEVAW